MIDLDRWQEVLDTIRQHKLRTLLTALSVAWGIFMLVILLGAGTGLRNGIQHQFRDDAINSIWITPGRTRLPHRGHASGRRLEFTNADYDQVKTGIDPIGLEVFALNRVLLGDADGAINALSQALELGWNNYMRIANDIAWKEMHALPEFQPILARTKSALEKQRAIVEADDAEQDFLAETKELLVK